MRKLFLSPELVFFLIAITLIAYNISSVYCADRSYTSGVDKVLQSGFDEANKGNLDAAIAYFNKAISLDEKNSGAYVGLGNAYLRKDDTYNAIGYFNKALFLDGKNAGAYVGLGNTYLRKGATEKAIAYFNQALFLDGKNAGAYVGLGNAYLRKGDTEKAIAYFNQTISLNWNNPPAHFFLGLLYLSLNKKESALEEYKILKNLNKSLADLLYERIQDKFDINNLIRCVWPMRPTDNPYLRRENKRKIMLYILKDPSKYDGARKLAR